MGEEIEEGKGYVVVALGGERGGEVVRGLRIAFDLRRGR